MSKRQKNNSYSTKMKDENSIKMVSMLVKLILFYGRIGHRYSGFFVFFNIHGCHQRYGDMVTLMDFHPSSITVKRDEDKKPQNGFIKVEFGRP